MKLLHVKHSAFQNKKTVLWQRLTFIAKYQSLSGQISKSRGNFENRLEKNEKIIFIGKKCDICTLGIMVDFH